MKNMKTVKSAGTVTTNAILLHSSTMALVIISLRDKYDKLGRKDRTVENMVSMAVSRELSKENVMAYASRSNTAIHTVKSFNNRPNSMSNNRQENKC